VTAMAKRAQARSHRQPVRRRDGTVTVELALVLPLILFLLFSIVEMGFMVKNRAELGQAAREAVRLGAVGGTPARMTEGVNSALATIPHGDISVELHFRPWNQSAGTWGSWTTLGTDGTENNASKGDQLRVRLTYAHPILVPGLMGPVFNAGEDNTISLSAATVMMRE
jgi:Flp pilus assembly protein TadG